MLRHRFTRFSDPSRLHFAAHSHHLWPDVTFYAHQQAWLDAASLVDEKWDRVLGEVLEETRAHISRQLNLSDPTTVALAPNTHELVVRLASCLDVPFRLVTTDAEFHSFRRQAARWEEAGLAEVVRVPAEPFDTFPARFGEVVSTSEPSLIYLSQVFYNSGYVVPDLKPVVGAAPESALFAVDGYHAFMALPVDLAGLADRVFYLAGGYKYAMAGEGACFMHCPPGFAPRPVDTGWMAEFGALASTAGSVAFPEDGNRFLGATFDPSPLYRFNAVQEMLEEEGVTVEAIHAHVGVLQNAFVAGLEEGPLQVSMIVPAWPGAERGNFVTFRTQHAADFQRSLRKAGVIVDHRGDRLRFGFGVYHEPDDVGRLLAIVNRLQPPQ